MRFFLFLLLAMASFSTAERHSCGTEKLMEHQRQIKSGLVAKSMARSSLTSCSEDSYYNKVSTLLTTHFIIYYTLEGPHATTTVFLDYLALYLEKAWTMHTSFLGMRPPKGMKHSYHYEQKNETGLYPVEVIDIDLIRNANSLMGGPCHGCFGLTYPGDETDPEASVLMIDNDFKYTPEYNSDKGFITDLNGKECSYPIASKSLYNQSLVPYSYADFPEKAIEVTCFHELYHAAQIRYVSFIDYPSFWFEASAVGVEEIGAPSVNDYWAYLTDFFKSTGTPLTSLNQDYGAGVLYLYLYKQNGPRFDASIWEAYSKNPEKPFDQILASQWIKKELNPDSSFHDFAKQLFFSGQRSSYMTNESWVHEDAAWWPEIRVHQAVEDKKKSLSPLAYDYLVVNSFIPDLTYFKGQASLILWDKTKERATVEPLQKSDDLYLYATAISNSDSAILVLSRLQENTNAFIPSSAKPLRSYPNPWKGSTPLCFSPLPQNQSFIEIRNRIGNLVSRVKTNSVTHCIDDDWVKNNMAPGLYHFRVGSHGKTAPLLLIY